MRPGRLARGLAVWAVLLVLAACSWVGGASAPVLNLDGEQRFSASLDLGQTLVLDMRNPGSGGYEFAGASFDPALLRLDANVLTPGGSRAGDFGRARFEFTALAPGRTDVVIKISRPFEKDVPPEIYKIVDVRVNGESGGDAGAEPAQPGKSEPSKPDPAKNAPSGDSSPGGESGQKSSGKSGWFSWFPWF